MMAKIIELVSFLETLLETIENNVIMLTSETLEYQPQLLNDEVRDVKNQYMMKCSQVVFVQINPLCGDDDGHSYQQYPQDKLIKTIPNVDEDEVIHEPTFQ